MTAQLTMFELEDYYVHQDESWIGPCARCGVEKLPTRDDPWGIDPCLLRYLPDVAHACCGHGVDSKAYVVISAGVHAVSELRGAPGPHHAQGSRGAGLLPRTRGWTGGDRVSALPKSITSEVQRILDGAARRLLAARLDRDPVAAAAGSDDGPLDDGADERAPLVEGEHVPVPARGDRHRRRRRGAVARRARSRASSRASRSSSSCSRAASRPRAR